MTMNEIERRKYLALQAFYLETKRAMEELEKKLSIKPPVKTKANVFEHREKVNV